MSNGPTSSACEAISQYKLYTQTIPLLLARMDAVETSQKVQSMLVHYLKCTGAVASAFGHSYKVVPCLAEGGHPTGAQKLCTAVYNILWQRSCPVGCPCYRGNWHATSYVSTSTPYSALTCCMVTKAFFSSISCIIRPRFTIVTS